MSTLPNFRTLVVRAARPVVLYEGLMRLRNDLRHDRVDILTTKFDFNASLVGGDPEITDVIEISSLRWSSVPKPMRESLREREYSRFLVIHNSGSDHDYAPIYALCREISPRAEVLVHRNKNRIDRFENPDTALFHARTARLRFFAREFAEAFLLTPLFLAISLVSALLSLLDRER